MQTRRDHLHAYQFATGRMASALVKGDPGTGEAPMRRSALGAVFGVLITALLVVAALIYGLLKPVDTTSWAKPGTLVVEKETATRYIYTKGQLHPVANYASALLALGGAPSVQDVSRSSLADVPRGKPIGIPGAPDDVPQPSQLLTGAWTDCLSPGADTGEVLDFAPRSTVPVAANARILVSGPDDAKYVLWQGVKYPVSNQSSLIALGLDTDQPIRASSAWLDALSTGPGMAPLTIPGAGTGTGTVGGSTARVGQLFRTAVGGSTHYYVLESDGMAPVSATEAALTGAARGGQAPRRVSAAAIAAVKPSADHSLLHRIPDVMAGTDATADGGGALCLRRLVNGSRLTSTLVRQPGRVPTAASAVLIPPDDAVLAVSAEHSSNSVTPAPYLITDQGVKYLLADQAAQALGFSDATPRVLPQSTLSRIPTGPRLSRTQAAKPLSGAN